MVICMPDSLTDRSDVPTPQAIELARQEQFQYVRDLRRKLAMTSLAGRVRVFRRLGETVLS